MLTNERIRNDFINLPVADTAVDISIYANPNWLWTDWKINVVSGTIDSTEVDTNITDLSSISWVIWPDWTSYASHFTLSWENLIISNINAMIPWTYKVSVLKTNGTYALFNIVITQWSNKLGVDEQLSSSADWLSATSSTKFLNWTLWGSYFSNVVSDMFDTTLSTDAIDAIANWNISTTLVTSFYSSSPGDVTASVLERIADWELNAAQINELESTWSLNEAPTFTCSEWPFAATEGTPFSEVLCAATDPEDDSLTYSLSGNGWATFSASTRGLAATPALADIWTETLVYSVTDWISTTSQSISLVTSWKNFWPDVDVLTSLDKSRTDNRSSDVFSENLKITSAWPFTDGTTTLTIVQWTDFTNQFIFSVSAGQTIWTKTIYIPTVDESWVPKTIEFRITINDD